MEICNLAENGRPFATLPLDWVLLLSGRSQVQKQAVREVQKDLPIGRCDPAAADAKFTGRLDLFSAPKMK